MDKWRYMVTACWHEFGVLISANKTVRDGKGVILVKVHFGFWCFTAFKMIGLH